MNIEFRAIAKKWLLVSTGVVIAFSLVACAGQKAFQAGKELVEKDQIEDGLSKFREASKLDPQSIEFKTAYYQTRDRAISNFLEQGDRYAAAANQVEAEAQYRRVLNMDAVNDRARDGLRKLDMEMRHSQLMTEAESALESKNVELAKRKIAIVLTENPNNEAANFLQRSMAEQNARPSAESQLANSFKKAITLEFKDVSIKQVFEVISRSSGLNFVFDKDVKTDQKTSVFLKNSTIESAVFYTLLSNQLDQQVLDGNTILIYPNTVAKQKDYQEMLIRTFFLTNAEAKAVASTLKTILKSRDVVIDEKLNMLIVRDTPDAIKLAEKLVALHDVAEPEVMLEVEILEVKRTRLLELGIKWPDSMSLTPLTTMASGGVTLNDLRNLNSKTIGVSPTPSVTLNARKNDSDANLLANPRIRARNHEKAKILIGDRVPNITTTATATGFVAESINYVDVGLKLDVEPTIYLDNDVAIKVALEVSNIVAEITTKSGGKAFQIGTRTASTVLRLKDGETQVLAGLINDEDRSKASKVPAMGDIPLLGRLFGTTENNNEKTEIVLSITPRLIRNIQRPDASLAQFRGGTETSLRLRPESTARSTMLETKPAVNPSKAASPKVSIQKELGAAPAPAVVPSAKLKDGMETDTATPLMPVPPAVNADEIVKEAPVSAASLSWKGANQSKVGSNFSLQLSMKSEQALSSLPLTIGFDSQIFQVVRVVEGDFMKRSGAPSDFSNQVDPKGEILLTANSSATGTSSNSTSGTVATITFRSLVASDASPVQVLASAPIGSSGRAINISLPEPQTMRVLP
jgi:general secretion pathway protein D